jgi:predicted phosphodiesterase
MSLRIQIASDLHLEHVGRYARGERLIRPAPDADLLVLAGDIANGADAVKLFADWPVPVLLVPGNHEHYHQTDFEATLYALRCASKGTAVTVLNNESFFHGGVRFLGSTLWTDYKWRPRGAKRATLKQAMQHAQVQLYDHRGIFMDGARFGPEQALLEHKKSVKWLNAQLAQPFDGPTVVISHHGPHNLSVHPRFEDSLLCSAFVSNLPDLLAQADLWIHGHTHENFDYTAEGCRVVANTRGYPRIRIPENQPECWVFENPGFNPYLVVEPGQNPRNSVIVFAPESAQKEEA